MTLYPTREAPEVTLPEWYATPEPGDLESIVLPSFDINWDNSCLGYGSFYRSDLILINLTEVP